MTISARGYLRLSGEARAGVGDGLLFENLALGVQHAHSVLAISEVESNSDGGFLGFHGSGSLPHQASDCPAAFSSILVRFVSSNRYKGRLRLETLEASKFPQKGSRQSLIYICRKHLMLWKPMTWIEHTASCWEQPLIPARCQKY